MLLALLLPALTARAQQPSSRLRFGLVALLWFQLTISLLFAYHGYTDRAMFAVPFYLLLFMIFAVGASSWITDERSAQRAVYALAAAGTFLAIGTAAQIIVDSGPAVRASRLHGTTGNAQHAAVAMATGLAPILYLIVRPGRSVFVRMGAAVIAALLVVFLVWTGSRTGGLMSLVAIAVLFRRRLGRLAIAALITSIVLLGVLQIVGTDAGANVDRLLSGEDTRSHMWAWAIQQFLSSPLVGVRETEAGFQENSYLAAAASFGLLGVLPLLAFVGWTLLRMGWLWRNQRWLGKDSFTADLVLAGLSSLFAGAFFEAFLNGAVSYPVFALMLYVVMLNYLTERITALQAAPATYDDITRVAHRY
jgi:O-antigen ligase